LFVVGLIVSGVAFTSRQRATDAAMLRLQVTVLQAYSRAVAAAEDTGATISITSQTLATLFQVPSVAMLVAGERVVSLERVGNLELQDAELEAARSSVATGNVVRAGLYPNLISRFDFWPVKSVEGDNAVIGLSFDPDERPSLPNAMIDIVGNVLSLALASKRAAPNPTGP
jgi:K+-sensing histidine kinase KdpD